MKTTQQRGRPALSPALAVALAIPVTAIVVGIVMLVLASTKVPETAVTPDSAPLSKTSWRGDSRS